MCNHLLVHVLTNKHNIILFVMLLSLGCGRPIWQQKGTGTLNPFICATKTRALYEHALIDTRSGEWLIDLSPGGVVASDDCMRFAEIDGHGNRLHVVERATEDGRLLREGDFPYPEESALLPSGMLLGVDDLVLVNSRAAYRLDLSSGQVRWGWQEPRRGETPNTLDGITMRTDTGTGQGRYWVLSCDNRPQAQRRFDKSMCVIDLETGERTEHDGFSVKDTQFIGDGVVIVLESTQIRAVEIGPAGIRDRWVTPFDEPLHTAAELTRDGERLLVETFNDIWVFDINGKMIAHLPLQRGGGASLSGDTLAYGNGFELHVRDLGTGKDVKLQIMPYEYEYFTPTIVGQDVIVSAYKNSSAYRLP